MDVNEDEGVYNLHIKSVNFQDEGEFQCQVGPAMNHTPIRAAAQLRILIPPDYLTVNGLGQASTMEVNENVTVRLTCQAVGSKPAAQLKWYKNNVEVPKADGKDLGKLSSLRSQLNDKFSRLEVLQKEMSSLFLEDTSTHFQFEADFEATESYRDSHLELETKVEAPLKSSKVLMQCSSMDNAPRFKLPRFELKEFSGDAREFLTFWSIFSKIHESDDLTEVDKFQYLYQCMVPESRAAGLISSFPIATENYSKAIQQLKARFGREDLLVQIYVRDLLSLVMENAVAGKSSPDLATLYDILETKLRALESLGRTKEKFADFLEPLVKSCLPESVLRAWECSRISGVADDSTSQRSLEKLMPFLRHEVEYEEMIKLALEGFVKNGGSFKRNKSAVLDNTDTATTAMLVSTTSSYVGTSTGKKNCIL
ncbi:hypothetical protein AVEN_13616-1 [Araneus ventricosus]|uniref:Ig-like domain-containing protein n=1 Tax=Araneus ventricosus TaxID=182803 RepID=A0A4Y2FN31_ARAVE|nr:hypothetical protein AVEN_13616-1 [Araneus ventricosus]